MADIAETTTKLIEARRRLYDVCSSSNPNPYGIGQQINELSYWAGEVSDYLGDLHVQLNDAKAQTYFGMIKSGQSVNSATESARHEHKELEGRVAKFKLLLDSANNRITTSQTILRTLDIEKNTGGQQV